MTRSRQLIGIAPLAALTILAALTVVPSAAAATSSPGVTPLRTLPERGLASAKAVGGLLYTSGTSGVSIYDIADPRRPVRIGRLDLPNVQNEDVDVGSGILLVSDDPFGGRGILHVIDVHDPRAPRLLSTYRTWIPGLLTGGFPKRSRRRRGGIGHTASCIQGCRYAWLAGSPDGIEVVDLRDPASPRFAGRFRARAAAGILTHDVQVDRRGLAWVAGGAGTAAYDTRRPARPRLVTRTDRRGHRRPWNNFIHHNSLRISPSTLIVTEEDLRTGCRRAGSIQTWRIGPGKRMRPLDRFGVEADSRAQTLCSAHYFDHRDGLVAAGFYEQGLRLLDVRRPRRIRQVGFHLSRSPMAWGALFAPTDPSGSVVYVIDHAQGIQVVELDRSALRPVRRRPIRGRRAPGRFDNGVFVDDGLETVRRGARLGIEVLVEGFSGSSKRRDVAVEVVLPAALRDVRPPRGASYDPATRILRFGLRRADLPVVRTIRARVGREPRLGSILEVIAYAHTPGDLLAITDRGVDRGRIARRTRRTRSASLARASPRGTRGLVCMLGPRGALP